MTFSLFDEEVEKNDTNEIHTVAILELALKHFCADIDKVVCPIGIFKDLKILSITLGTKDMYAIYKIRSNDFCLDFEKVNELLKLNNEDGDSDGE